jgi:hypothetical protein
VAGGDEGGKLGGAINLATSTVSSASAQIFNTAGSCFAVVGSLNTPRESAAAVALPNGLTLIAGGETCGPMTYGGQSGFQCNALNTAELYNESTQTFTYAGSGSGYAMTSARSGPTTTLIEGSGTSLDGQVLIVGGSKGSSFLSIVTPPASSGVPSGQVGLNTAELYNPTTDTFTALTNTIPTPFLCPGTASPITSTAESGTTVTVTSAANPAGLTIGDNVTIEDVSVVGYNGTFAVTAIPSGTTFQYSVTPTGLAAGSGGTAAADTFQCGMVDQGAAVIPNSSGQVLLAGGDLIQFLGQSSNLSFIFNPATQTFTQTTGSLNTPRELEELVAMDPAVVTGPLAGYLVAFGGVEATSANCVINSTSSGTVVVTTLNTAEVYDPSTQTWSVPASTMGAKRAGYATLFETGPLAGEVILPGGVDVEAGTLPSTCVAATGIKQAATAETDLYNPGTGTGGTFSATGALNQPREGQGQAIIGAGADETDVLVIGGACTTPIPSLQSVTIGTAQAATTCGTANAQNDYSELYSQSSNTWTVGPSFAPGFTPTNAAATVVLP